MLRVVLAGQREGTQAHAFFPFHGFRVTAAGIQRPPLFGALETRWSVPGMETGGPHVPSLCPSLGASSQPHFFFLLYLLVPDIIKGIIFYYTQVQSLNKKKETFPSFLFWRLEIGPWGHLYAPDMASTTEPDVNVFPAAFANSPEASLWEYTYVCALETWLREKGSRCSMGIRLFGKLDALLRSLSLSLSLCLLFPCLLPDRF